MADIKIVKHAGFCYGVKRAYQIACEAAEKPGYVATLGDLIHNRSAVAALKKLGVESIKKVDQHPGGRLIIRAHGATIDELHRAEHRGLSIIDATCPHVKIVQDAAVSYAKKGYFIVILGDRGHPEVLGIESRIPRGKSITVISPDQLSEDILNRKRVAIITQTTQSPDRLEAIVVKLLGGVKELVIKNTICHATAVRQQETVALAKEADCMIIIGGRHSANTIRLRELSGDVCGNTRHIEGVDELDEGWFQCCQLIGISAGASTPDDLIKEVYNRIDRLLNRSDSL